MRARVVLAAVCVACAGRPAAAYFESSAVGARSLALGNNFVSVADDATALYWNPAGLVRLSQHEAMFTLDHSPDLADVRRGFAAVALYTSQATFGVGWQSVHLEDALAEDMIYLAVSRLLVRRSLGAFISGGATLKIAHVGVDAAALAGIAGASASQTHMAADLGGMLSPIPNVTVGMIARNLGQPRFDLVPGGATSELRREFEWGVSFRWREDAQFHWSHRTHPNRSGDNKLGVDLGVGEHLALQLGVARELLTGGFGVAWRSWQLETSFQAHEVLGVLTRVGVRFGFGRDRGALGGAYDDF